MADKKLSQLDELTAPNYDDLMYVVDVSDTASGSSGNSKQLKHAQNVANVIQYGADPTGASDSTTAFQSAIDSDYMFFCPPGYYKITSPITIDKPKYLLFQGTLPFVANDDPTIVNDHARVFVETNINFFDIQSGGVTIRNGVFDTQNVTNHTSSVFYLNPDANNWGSSFLDWVVIGNAADITDAGSGTKCVYFDASSGTVNGGYITQLLIRGKARDVGYGYLDTDANQGAITGQFANGTTMDLEIHGAKKAIELNTLSEAKIRLKYQAQWVLDSSEQSNAVVELNTSRNELDFINYDLSNSPDGNGHYKQNVSVINNSVHNRIKTESPASINKGTYNEEPYSGRLMTPSGYVARMRTHSSTQPQPAAFSELHNFLIAADKRYTTTVAAYDGTEVSDFSTLTRDSVTEGISTSSDITIDNSGSLFSPYLQTGETKFTWNSSATTDGDYVEVHIDFGTTVNINKLWLCLDVNREAPTSIQVISLDSGASVLQNEIRTITTPSPSLSPNRVFSFDVSSNPQEIICRFIGSDSADDNCTVYDFAAFLGGAEDYRPYIHTYGGQTIYGDLIIGDGSWNGDGLLRLGDYRLWVDSTGDLRIKNGAPSNDTDGTVVGTQS